MWLILPMLNMLTHTVSDPFKKKKLGEALVLVFGSKNGSDLELYSNEVGLMHSISPMHQ